MMAFLNNNFGRVSSTAADVPVVYSYQTTVDTMAQVLASAYFNDKINQLKVSDIIYVKSSDDQQFLKVTSVTTNVTTAQFSEVVDDGSITTVKLADLAVTTAKLDNLAVTAGKLDALAVTTAKLDNLAVTTAKIAALAVTTAKIAALAVTDAELAVDSVINAKIATGAVDTDELADDAVTTVKITNLNVTTAKIALDAVDNTLIADNAVSLENLDSGITMSHIDVFVLKHTTVGGSASEAVTVTGAVAASDFVVATLTVEGASPVTLDASNISSDNTVTLTFSADPSSDHIVTICVKRAAA